MAEWFRRGGSVEKAHALTRIDPFFLGKIEGIIRLEQELSAMKTWDSTPGETGEAKRSD